MPEPDFYKQAQSYYAESPTIILGSGASMDFGLPSMAELAAHLIVSVDTSSFAPSITDTWKHFCDCLDSGTDLETALTQIPLPTEATDLVVEATWNFINPVDLSVFENSLVEPNLFPLSRLIKGMFQSAKNKIEIIITNYDRLVEYACDQAGHHYFTGFTYGYHRRLADEGQFRANRTVNIWKVHGSLDWFKHPTGSTYGVSNLSNMPNGHKPQIVTPGVEKYRLTHLEPFRTTITQADHALQSAHSYLCIGFGFNDQHIQEKLIEKCVRDRTSITVLTYSLTDTAKTFLLESGVENYLAIERGESDGHSIIHSSQHDAPVVVQESLWTLTGYLSLIH